MWQLGKYDGTGMTRKKRWKILCTVRREVVKNYYERPDWWTRGGRVCWRDNCTWSVRTIRYALDRAAVHGTRTVERATGGGEGREEGASEQDTGIRSMYRRHTSQHQFLWRRRLGGTLRRSRGGGRWSGGSSVLLKGEGGIVSKQGFTGNNYRAPANGRLTCSLARSGCNDKGGARRFRRRKCVYSNSIYVAGA